MKNKTWFKVDCTYAHQRGNPRSPSRDGTLYIFVESTIKALDRYKTIPGVHRSQVPSISKLSEEGVKELELIIIGDEAITISNAKKRWYKTFLGR